MRFLDDPGPIKLPLLSAHSLLGFDGGCTGQLVPATPTRIMGSSFVHGIQKRNLHEPRGADVVETIGSFTPPLHSKVFRCSFLIWYSPCRIGSDPVSTSVPTIDDDYLSCACCSPYFVLLPCAGSFCDRLWCCGRLFDRLLCYLDVFALCR